MFVARGVHPVERWRVVSVDQQLHVAICQEMRLNYPHAADGRERHSEFLFKPHTHAASSQHEFIPFDAEGPPLPLGRDVCAGHVEPPNGRGITPDRSPDNCICPCPRSGKDAAIVGFQATMVALAEVARSDPGRVAGADVSEQQLRLLRDRTNRLCVALDDDRAGWQGTMRLLFRRDVRFDLTVADYRRGSGARIQAR